MSLEFKALISRVSNLAAIPIRERGDVMTAMPRAATSDHWPTDHFSNDENGSGKELKNTMIPTDGLEDNATSKNTGASGELSSN